MGLTIGRALSINCSKQSQLVVYTQADNQYNILNKLYLSGNFAMPPSPASVSPKLEFPGLFDVRIRILLVIDPRVLNVALRCCIRGSIH